MAEMAGMTKVSKLAVVILLLASVALVSTSLYMGFPAQYRPVPCVQSADSDSSTPKRTSSSNQCAANLAYYDTAPKPDFWTQLFPPYAMAESAEGLLMIALLLALSRSKVPSFLRRGVELPRAVRYAALCASLAAASVYVVYVITDMVFAYPAYWTLTQIQLSFGGEYILRFGTIAFSAYAVSVCCALAALMRGELWVALKRATIYAAVPLLLFLQAMVLLFDPRDMMIQVANFVGWIIVGGSTLPHGGAVYGVPLISNVTVLLVSSGVLLLGLRSKRRRNLAGSL